jgi:membrane protease YdiL (CAAX protease family)
MQIRTSIKNHPLLAYFVLTFAISWGASLGILGPKFFRSETLRIADAAVALVGMMLGPFLSGLILTVVADGRAGLQALWSRMRKWRVGLRWWAAALLIFPVTLIVVLLLLSRLISPAYALGFETLGIIYGLLAGIFEETGWTGFAVPRLTAKYGALIGAAILGVLHGIWHIVADFMGSSSSLGSYWFPHFAALWIVGLVAFRILMVWVYNSTGSVLLAQLMHASFTGSLVILTPTPIIPANETFWYVIFAFALWVVAAIVIAKVGKRLAQPAVAA